MTRSSNHVRHKFCSSNGQHLIYLNTVELRLFSAKATYAAIAKTYSYLTPDLWKETLFQKSPYQEYSDYLQKNHRPVGTQKEEVKQY